MTSTSDAPRPQPPIPSDTSPAVRAELAAEQAHVDRVYAELEKAARRAKLVAAEGHARARSDRSGEVRDEELTGLFERDALVFHAARRQQTLDTQYEGLVFGRLDLEHVGGPAGLQHAEREVRYIGRLGIRDDDYEPLVIDWRAPAAAPFYRATPVDPLGVLRRRVLRCRGSSVVGVEDDLMVPQAPPDLVVVGDGALMAALTRTRGAQMRDIVATIQRHQDEAIRAPVRGVTEITGGPGTGKTVVALHRAAYLLYSDRRRYESGGILVVGPSAAYTAYIERVLPSLGEGTVTLRSAGDIVDAVSTERHDEPAAAAVKGSLRMREVLARAARDAVPGAPTELRAFVAGEAIRIDSTTLGHIRTSVLRQHLRNHAMESALTSLGEAAYRASHHPDKAEFLERFGDHLDVEAFLAAWWPPVDPREVLLWLADRDRLDRYAAGLLDAAEVAVVHASMQVPLETGTWSVSDVALIDDLAARLGPVQVHAVEERGFYEIEELDDLAPYGVTAVHSSAGRGGAGPASRSAGSSGRQASGGAADDDWPEPNGGRASLPRAHDTREQLLVGRLDRPSEYAHVLVDEAQDLSPMQWRMLGRRGRHASWTVVGDAAQSTWADPDEAAGAREEAWGGQPRRRFHMDTNYRNAREIFAYAEGVIRAAVPDADIPEAVRVTGIEPVDVTVPLPEGVAEAVELLLDAVDGTVAVVTPTRYAAALAPLAGQRQGRVRVVDPLSTKGLEYDATVVVDPDEIVRESPGGVRLLYVALTRAAHRMTVLRPGSARPAWGEEEHR